ncbi:hypothetical protein V3399_30220 [Pseudomonas aeruginosa]|uniref:hypothetical protein n=1 Tax=Pseudomonas aeruginosa TaxID=287 RepID=UPI001872C5DA|nr:hypothetical protein [Pseudomonas aeruginosa]NUB39831.1 hypothetical protein [Pseudomonas aeruginosa]HBO0237953.1 hypothetical protein [Pseudomonas aeruginosa]HBO0385363.1 hypothetical protein [Pseudomonas aeruginosa]HBO2612131.1 hypothetical protein [Pseudomonas aeruginosa]HCG1340803.1 hypothetical protein [Pseudomonas aeruginosa]
MTNANECTCPSGDGSLRHPCPAHPAPVEQVGTNVGHGHVFPRADGVKMRCGGPGLCSECAADASRARAALAQPSPTLPPFAEKVLAKLRRFYDCAEDFESGGVDIGRHWLDLLTQLGLLNRVQRSPALWEISQQGEDLLGTPHPSPAQAEKAEAERQEGPTEDELEAAGLGYPLHKEEAVKLWYSGFRSEVITVLEAWEAIGHDTGINPDKEELLDSLRYMLEKCEAHDAALARAAELEKELAMTRDAASKGDAARHAAGGMEMEIQELKAKLAEQAQHSAPEVFGLERYRVERTGQGFWPYCVRAGDGTRELFVGHLKQCKRVAAQLATAFEDGKFIARLPTVQAQHSVPEISGIGRDAEHPRAVVLYLRNEPSDEDMRAIQNFLRAISADVLTQAQHSVPELLEWAVGRWHAEVSLRPLINVHRRALDDTWRQVIRRLGGDTGLLCGPSHDELLAAAPGKEGL